MDDAVWKHVAEKMSADRFNSKSLLIRLIVSLSVWFFLMVVALVTCVVSSVRHTVINNLRVVFGFLKTAAVSLVLTIRRNK